MGGKRGHGLLSQIEREILADKPLDSILRKLILLGGRAGSSELRDWAAKELRGYRNDEDLPAYRKVPAVIQIDGAVPGGHIQHQSISTMDLPDFAQDEIDEIVPLTLGVGEIQAAIAQHRGDRMLKLQLPGGSLLVKYMNGTQHFSGTVTDLYWAVSTISLEGVLDQIRTRLAELVGELLAGTPLGQELPSAEQASNAVALVINGRGARVSINQASGGGTIATTTPSVETESGFWTAGRRIGALLVGVATVAGVGIAWWQLQLTL